MGNASDVLAVKQKKMGIMRMLFKAVKSAQSPDDVLLNYRSLVEVGCGIMSCCSNQLEVKA